MTLSMLAQRIEQLTGQINELNQRLTRLVERHAPQLLVPVGIGPDSAVTLLITMGDNPERLNTEASFAALCGVSPIEHSSGRRRTRRLAPHRLHPPAPRPAHAGVLRTPHPGGQDPTRDHPMPDMPPERSSTWSGRYPASPWYRGVGDTAKPRRATVPTGLLHGATTAECGVSAMSTHVLGLSAIERSEPSCGA
ncbi:transposase [Streptomyces sp. NPDC127079]|uniref:transposase n=1 Tax=Streptomyces sp. NPDC127079 TaxID=3347132 RepID=UPI0036565D69